MQSNVQNSKTARAKDPHFAQMAHKKSGSSCSSPSASSCTEYKQRPMDDAAAAAAVAVAAAAAAA